MAIALIAKVLLTVLKAALFLLLAVIIILLFILCLVLFSSLKYNLYAEKYDAIKAEGKVSWMLGIVVFSFCYNDGGNSYKLKVFGADYKKLAGFLAKFFKKKEKEIYGLENTEELVNNKNEIKEEDYEKKKENKTFSQKEKNFTGDKDKTDVKENKTDAYKSEIPQKNPEVEIRNKEFEKAVRHDKHSGEDKDKRTSSNFASIIKNFWKKIKLIPVNIKNTFNKIDGKIKEFKKKIRKMPEAFRKGADKSARVKEFLFSETTKDMFVFAKGKLFYLLKKIKPRKIKSDILIGTGSPCQTGQILGAAAVYMAMSGTFLNITPDFENKVLKGRILISGHIRAVTLLAAFLKVIISSEWKSFYKEAKNIKEEF